MSGSDYFAWIEKFLSPPGINKTNWGRLYKLLGQLADDYSGERVWLLRQHFALSCEPEHLVRLGRIYALPRWSFESDEGYRNRLIAAGFELEAKGTIQQFCQFMNDLFVDDWESNGEDPAVFAVGLSDVGRASVGGIDVLRVGIKAVNAFTAGNSVVGKTVVGGAQNTANEQELQKFLDWFLAADIAYEVYYI